MKIGILTFHSAHNYGAVLQAYALQKYLMSFNHTVEFINYNNEKLLRVYKWFEFKRFKTLNVTKFYTEFKLLSPRKRRFVKFESFIDKYLYLSPKNYDTKSYDVIIIGSDQVWNTDLTSGFDKMYWGNFVIKNECNLISYAASMQDEISESNKLQIKKLLGNFSGISVREDSIARNLAMLLGIDIPVVLDPTLLLSSNEWEQICANKIVRRPYLLFYQVRKNEKAKLIAEQIAENLNLEIVNLSAGIDLNNSPEFIDAGPLDFVSLFKNASYVVCTSFHGTVFSIIFNVPFCSIILNDGKDNRVLSLLSKLNLVDRGITHYSDDILRKKLIGKKLTNVYFS